MYDVLTWLVTMFMLDYIVGPFVLYDIPRSIKAGGPRSSASLTAPAVLVQLWVPRACHASCCCARPAVQVREARQGRGQSGTKNRLTSSCAAMIATAVQSQLALHGVVGHGQCELRVNVFAEIQLELPLRRPGQPKRDTAQVTRSGRSSTRTGLSGGRAAPPGRPVSACRRVSR